jgi:hypothetical protein
MAGYPEVWMGALRRMGIREFDDSLLGDYLHQSTLRRGKPGLPKAPRLATHNVALHISKFSVIKVEGCHIFQGCASKCDALNLMLVELTKFRFIASFDMGHG